MTTVTLAGVPFVALEPVGWTETVGTRPFMRTFEMPTALAEKAWLQRGAPVRLEIASGGSVLAWDELILVDLRAGARPDTRAVLVADRRWRWGRKHIVRDFNMRRRSGDTRLVGESRIETAPVALDATYALYSLDNGTPHTLASALASVMDELDPGAWDATGVRLVPLESVALDDRGDAALERLLAYGAGVAPVVRPSGRIEFVNLRDGSEADMIAALPPVVVGTGFHARADKSQSRPIGINVLFDRESEVRFDFIEATAAAPSTAVRGDVRPPRRLENVIPLPDVELVVAGKRCSRGTWVNIDAYLAAIAGLESTTMAAALGPLSQRIIRINWLAKWSYVVGLYTTGTNGQPDPTWQKRIDAIRKHWRQTFRLPPEWRSKVRGAKAIRAAIVDPETGTRAVTEPYMDYVARPSLIAFSRPTAATERNSFGRQVEGYAELLEDAIAAPAQVQFLDEEAGVLRSYLLADPFGDVDALAPGQMEHVPTWKYDGALASVAQGAQVYGLWAVAALEEGYRLAVVITLHQGSPNSRGRKHLERVTPDMAAQALGLPGLGECGGPDWDEAVGAGVLTARTAWLDSMASPIEESFYEGAAIPAELIVNRVELQAVALDAAARIYATMIDRTEGAFSVPFTPAARCTGAVSSVEHVVDLKGRGFSRVTIAPEIDPPSQFAFVPESVQRVVRRLATP